MWSRAYLAQSIEYSVVDIVNDLQRLPRSVSMVLRHAVHGNHLLEEY